MKNIYEATIEEKGIWLKNESYTEEEKNTLIEAAALKISGSIDYHDIEKTVYFFIKQTPIVRASFKLDDNKIIKTIHHDLKRKKILSFYDFTKTIKKEKLEKKLHDILQKSIDISKEVIHFSLCKYEKDSYILLLSSHHIIADHISVIKSLSDIILIYQDIITNNTKNIDLMQYETSYTQYMLKRDKRISEDLEAENYWKEKFNTNKEFSFLQQDYVYPEDDSLNSGLIIKRILATKSVKQYARKNRVTPFIVLLSVLNLLIIKRFKNKLSCATSIAFSTRDKITKDTLGCFINALPLIIHSSLDTKFNDFLKIVRDEIKNLSQYKQYPFYKVNNLFHNVRDLPYHPLQRIITTYTIYKPFSTKVNHVELSSFPIRSRGTGGADLSIVFADNGQDIDMEMNYNKDIFKKETIINFTILFNMLLEEVLADDNFEKSLKEYRTLSKQEEQQLLVEYNDTKVDYPKDKCIHQLFEVQVKLNPENIAVVYEDKELTYQELNTKSNQLAHYLLTQGVKPDSLVAICVDRSLEMMIGLLAILKAGGAYVPIDPTYPEDRIKHMLDDSQAKILLTQSHLEDSLLKAKRTTITIDTLDTSKEKKSNPKTKVSSSSLAYVIYTSGSTGLPKGVMIEHRGVVNLAQAQIDIFNVSKKDKILQFASFGFDAASFEIVMALLSGGQLMLIDKPLSINAKELESFIQNNDITVGTIPPVMLALLDETKLHSLKTIISAGEACPLTIVRKYANNTNLFNAYGPTESSVCASMYLCSIEDQISPPIGRPINNTQLYILDKHLNPVPKGVAGELHIAGDGLARGYLNQPELTKEKFIDNPFNKGTRLYKTGDLVRYLEDGNIEYIGRIDDQVKIRGFRIELGEIEQQLLNIEEIKESVVLAKEDENGNKPLVAYITTENNEEIESSIVKSTLSQHLPEYMIPVAFKTLESMPLTSNGKVDKKALAKLDVEIQSSREYVAPRNETEEKLAKIFQEVLNVEKVGIYDNFFELGGHSLLALQLISLLNKAFDLSLPVNILFISSEIYSLSEAIQQKENRNILPLQKKGDKIPIFAIPGLAAHAFCFHELAFHLGEEQPFYGIETVGIHGDIAPLHTIADVVKQNIQDIKEVAPKGPYILIGHSLGAMIAYETALMLQKQGDEVHALILLDGILINAKMDETNLRKTFIVNGLIKSYLMSQGIELKEEFCFDKDTTNDDILAYLKLQGIVLSVGQLNGFLDTAVAQAEIINRYIPSTMKKNLSTSLLRIKESSINLPLDYNWNKFLKNNIDVVMIPGDHISMLNKKNSKYLAGSISKILDK